MNRLRLVLSTSLFFAQLSAQNSGQEIARPHEFMLAFGTASSSENSVFNLPANDIQASPDFTFYLGYYYSFSERFAVGSHIYGFTQTIKNVGVTDASSTFKIVSFDLFPYNIGLQARYLLMTGGVEPFVSGMVNFVAGTLENKDFGTLTMFGFSAGGTAGVRIFLFESVTLSVQGVVLFGTASFKGKPFLNSDGRDFNPSTIGLLFSVDYHWGDF